jgi:tetratricopeptide (TPR) repeat protein
MLKKRIGLLACMVFLHSTGVLPAATQQESTAVGPAGSLAVYVVDFRQAESSLVLGDLGTLFPQLIQLRLLQVPSLTVYRVPQAPACGGQPPRENPLLQLPASQGLRPTTAPSGGFYSVRGSVEVQPPDIVLEYFVEKCDGQNFKPLFEDTRRFTADQALEELTISAHAIAFKLEQTVPRTRVAVAIEIDGDSLDQKAVQAEVHRRVSTALSESSDLEVADTGDYKVGGRITFEKQGSRLRIRTKWDTVATEELYIQAHDTKYPLRAVSKSRDKLPEFYTQIVDEVRRNLPVVVLAEKRGWTEFRGKMEIKALLSRGSQLLDKCPKEARICRDAQDAIPVLAAAIGKDPEGREGRWLLGRAQMLAGQYSDAAKSLEKARGLLNHDHDAGRAVSPKDETQVLNLLGDAYRNLEKYNQAEASYDASLQIMPSQPDVYASKALALRLEGKRPEALESLLEGLQASSPGTFSQSLHATARDIIRALRPGEFAKAEEVITRTKGVPVADEYALLISRKEGQNLDAKWTAENAEEARGPLQKALDLQPSDPNVRVEVYANLARTHLFDRDLQKLDFFLTQAEKLPPDQVSADNREWVARIRTRYWMMRKEYLNAYDSADLARHIKPTKDADFMAAEAALYLAQDKEKAARTLEQKAEFTKFYQQAADLAAPLVAKRFPGADYVLVEASHPLGLDAKTREQLQSVVSQNPKDDSALNALILVCSQYLFDFDCAFSAAKMDAALQDPNGPDAATAYLNLAEVAILLGNDGQTRDWLGIALIALKQPKVAPREKSLAYLYRLWLAMRQGQTDQFSADFQSWQTATEEFRKTNNDLNWLFLGARKALQGSQIGEKQKELLTAMMDALEDGSRPLPAWLESGAP